MGHLTLQVALPAAGLPLVCAPSGPERGGSRIEQREVRPTATCHLPGAALCTANMSRLTDPARLQKEIDAQKKRAEGESTTHGEEVHNTRYNCTRTSLVCTYVASSCCFRTAMYLLAQRQFEQHALAVVMKIGTSRFTYPVAVTRKTLGVYVCSLGLDHPAAFFGDSFYMIRIVVYCT